MPAPPARVKETRSGDEHGARARELSASSTKRQSTFANARPHADTERVADGRKLMIVSTCAAVLVLALMGCGGDSTSAGGMEEYPIVEPPAAEHQPPVTLPGGAVVTLPALPEVYEVEPSPTCERVNASYPDGSKRAVVVPPAPGLRAVAVTERTTRLQWSFRSLPDDCRPVELLLAVVNGTDPRATPTVERGIEATGLEGSKEITYPDFLPPPDVARASAYLTDGRRSRVVSVLIERPANTPPDPPEPIPAPTAPAGEPVACTSSPTVVEEPAGDVLTHAPGKPPTRVRGMTLALSGIDITRAAVQIDGRRICASFTFARPPESPAFELALNVHDTTERYCCATLRFRGKRAALEVGHFFVDANGVYQLKPVADAGAALRGRTLVLSGTLPDPSTWEGRARRMPAPANLGWSVTTSYFTDKYGPYFGDWLPRHEPVGQPFVRHRDGTIVEPSGG